VPQRHGLVAPSGADAATTYTRHRPEETVLFAALQQHWSTFVADLEASAEPPPLPAFVVAEVSTGGASGAAGAAAGSSGAATGVGGATAGAGGGATGSGTAGAPASTGAAGSGAKPPHASSGGCSVAAQSVDVAGVGLVVFGLAWLTARRSSRRRRPPISCTSR
jgi:hypothetical protein